MRPSHPNDSGTVRGAPERSTASSPWNLVSIFSVVQAVLLKPAPYADASRLVQVSDRRPVHPCLTDYLGASAASILIAARMGIYAIAARIPVFRDAADRSLVRELTKQLAQYGHAELTTNAETYRPTRNGCGPPRAVG
jgi:hypothetical protein